MITKQVNISKAENLTNPTLIHPALRWAGQSSENLPTKIAIIKYAIVMKKLPQRSRGRLPNLSIVHKLLSTPMSYWKTYQQAQNVGIHVTFKKLILFIALLKLNCNIKSKCRWSRKRGRELHKMTHFRHQDDWRFLYCSRREFRASSELHEQVRHGVKPRIKGWRSIICDGPSEASDQEWSKKAFNDDERRQDQNEKETLGEATNQILAVLNTTRASSVQIKWPSFPSPNKREICHIPEWH